MSRFRRYGLYFLAWTVYGLFLFSQGLSQRLITGDPTPWPGMLAAWLIGSWVLAALAPIVFWLGRRFPIQKRLWARRVGLHLLFSIGFAFLDLAAATAATAPLGIVPVLPRDFARAYPLLLLLNFHGSVTTYWMVLGLEHAIQYYKRYREREKEAMRLELRASELQGQLVQAQLSTLKAQLQPHFLFNTLNAIMVLVRQQRGPQAEEMLGRLSDLLRCVLENVEVQEVPLRRELEYLDLYLAIEQVRFQDRLRVEIDTEPGTLDAAVPHLVLQPIVENAIRHGIGRSSSAGKIRISAARTETMLEVKVEDDGPGINVSSGGPGIGLTNTRSRLQQLYGASGDMTLQNGPRGGAVATLRIPYHAASGEAISEFMEVHAAQNIVG